MGQQEPSFTAGGKANTVRPLGRPCDSLLQTKRTFTVQSSDRAPWHLPKEAENLCSQESLHTNTDSSFIHRCRHLEQTKCPSVDEGNVNCGTSRQWSTRQSQREISYLAMKDLNSNYGVKEANLQRPRAL